MNYTSTLRRLVLSASLLGLIGSGCEPVKEAPQPQPFADVVRAFEAQLPQELEGAAAERAGRIELQHLLYEEPRRTSLQLRNDEIVLKLYNLRKNAPNWVDPAPNVAALSPEGESLYANLLDAEPVHGLWREDYHLDRIASLLSKAGDKDLRPVALEGLTPQEKINLSAILVEHPRYAQDPDTIAQAIADGEIPLPRLKEQIDRRVEAIKVIASTKATLDLLLTDGLVSYGKDQLWTNKANHRNVVWPEALSAPQDETAVAQRQLNRSRRAHLAFSSLESVFRDPKAVHQVLVQLTPQSNQYKALTGAFQTYAKIAADGGWNPLSETVKKLRVGSRNDDVVELKKRLAAEAYWEPGELSNRFTSELASAVKEYQRTHQLWEEGWVTPETLRSMNVPADRRRDQVRVTLDRWRESRIGTDSVYVHVNIPDFHAEVWEEGERAMRFRVVTGSSARKWNKEKQINEFVNATPRMTGGMQHIVFNPFWNVPENILKNELEPKSAENPLYFAENGYEWATDDFGQPYVRQRPGPGNALGHVKFMFPNPHHVFLHDTNERGYFNRPVRALSHGCVRVEDPMELAKYLLGREGKWNDEDVATWMARDTETWIKLDSEVPVHIEYYVTRVDGLGRTHFLADVYRLDTPRVAEVQRRLKEREAQQAKLDVVTDTTPATIR